MESELVSQTVTSAASASPPLPPRPLSFRALSTGSVAWARGASLTSRL